MDRRSRSETARSNIMKKNDDSMSALVAGMTS
jgi:hypothetical protein